MTVARPSRSPAAIALAVVLLGGTVALGLGGALHPMLPEDVPGQLAVIARTPAWRAIHLIMLAGSVLVVVGLPGQIMVAAPRARRYLALIVAVIVVGLLLNMSNIAFMAAMGTADAARYAGGQQDVVLAFAGRHAASLTRAAVGNTLVALGCGALAVVEWRHDVAGRYTAVLAAIAAIGGIVGVLGFDPASRAAVAAVALFAVWAAVAAIRVLSGR